MTFNAPNTTTHLHQTAGSIRIDINQQRGASSILIIAALIILASLSALVISIDSDDDIESAHTELPAVAEPTKPGTGAATMHDAARSPAEEPISQSSADDTSQTISAEHRKQVAGEYYSAPSDTSPAAQIPAYTDVYESTTSRMTASVEDTDSDEDMTEAELQQQWQRFWAATVVRKKSDLPTTVEEISTAADTVVTDTAETGSDVTESTDTSTTETDSDVTESTDTSTTGEPDTVDDTTVQQTYCGKTEAELYDWFKLDPNASFQFMWECDDLS